MIKTGMMGIISTGAALWPCVVVALSLSSLVILSSTKNGVVSVQALSYSPPLSHHHRSISGWKSLLSPQSFCYRSNRSTVRLNLFPLHQAAQALVAACDKLHTKQSAKKQQSTTSRKNGNVNAVSVVEEGLHYYSSSHSVEMDDTLPPVVDATIPNDYRYSASDWLHNMRSVPHSSILQAIKGPVLAVLLWSTLVSMVYGLVHIVYGAAVASRFCIGSRLHSFLVSALGLLLVFRTNSAYQRFNEGRNIWERILSVSRNLSRLAVLYEQNLGNDRRRRLFRLLAAFPYLLRHHIQPHHHQCEDNEKLENSPFGLQAHLPLSSLPSRLARTKSSTKNSNVMSLLFVDHPQLTCWVDKRNLPWSLFPESVLSKCLQAANRPLWVCDRLSQEINDVAYTSNFTSLERMAFLSHIEQLSQLVGESERIQQTAVPLNYARHSLRSLTLWLFSLPFGLVQDFGWWTGPVMGLAAWLLYGIYQIGYQIEDPFQGSLQLSALCDAIYRDTMYGTDFMRRRETAFTVAPPEELESWQSLDDTTASPVLPSTM